MRLFDTNVQELKYKVLREVVRLAWAGTLERNLYEIPRSIIPGPKATMRCCIYKERAIVEDRVKLAMGGDRTNPNIVEVLGIACDECPTGRYTVTEACRGCIAHRCQSACRKGAISFHNQKAVIDPEKCVECGLCRKECPYGAILELQRPCMVGCKAGAIALDAQKKATIREERCTRCGTCVYQCPFGAIVDKSELLEAVDMLKAAKRGDGPRVHAIIAPSIAGQFRYARTGQILQGILHAGFADVTEVALGADFVAAEDARELEERGFLLSSCCPAFVRLVKTAFPDMADAISSCPSPMTVTARLVKANDPSSKVVFIGPCVAKKMERAKDGVSEVVDCVVTFEELQALFDGLEIDVEHLDDLPIDEASCFGRNFAKSGGVAAAVARVLQEEGSAFELRAETCDGLEQCRAALLKASRGKMEANFIEGMACEGGCIAGAACLSHAVRSKASLEAHAAGATRKNITDGSLHPARVQ